MQGSWLPVGTVTPLDRGAQLLGGGVPGGVYSVVSDFLRKFMAGGRADGFCVLLLGSESTVGEGCIVSTESKTL